MSNFEQTLSNLPTTDKDGNPITDDNPLTLEDIVVSVIPSTDPVLGLVPGMELKKHSDAPYVYPLLRFFLRDIFLDERITQAIAAVYDRLAEGLDNIVFPEPEPVPKATETLAGILEIANQTEGRSGTNHNRAMTSLRVLDFIRNGSGVSADTTRKGTVERATQAEATKLNDTTRYLTAALVKVILQHANAEATTTKRGTVELWNGSGGDRSIPSDEVVTPERLLNFFKTYEQDFSINVTVTNTFDSATFSRAHQTRTRTSIRPRRITVILSGTSFNVSHAQGGITVSWDGYSVDRTKITSVSVSHPASPRVEWTAESTRLSLFLVAAPDDTYYNYNVYIYINVSS